MRRRVESARVGHLGTAGPAADGGPAPHIVSAPHVVPVCYALVGEVVYTAVDHKPKRSTRLRRIANIEATGRACLLVDEYDEDWTRLWWVRLDGAARVLDDPAEIAGALDALVGKYAQYAARRPDGPVLALDIERWTSWTG